MTAARKRTYFILMGLGAVAVFIDRVFLSGGAIEPAHAIAHEGRSRPRPAPRATQGGSKPGGSFSTTIPELPFPRKLPAFDPASVPRDLFAPVPIDENGNAILAAVARPRRDAARVTASQFASRHKLEAVLVGGDRKIAVVDGTSLHIGDFLDGCTLVDVLGTSVELLCSDARVMLKLPNPLDK